MGNALHVKYVHSQRYQQINWRSYVSPPTGDISLWSQIETGVELAIAAEIMAGESQEPCSLWSSERFLKGSPQKFVELLMGWGKPSLLRHSPFRSSKGIFEHTVWIEWPDGVVSISLALPKGIDPDTTNQDLEDKFYLSAVGRKPWLDALAALVIERTSDITTCPSPSIHILAKGVYGDSLTVKRLGAVGAELHRGNYTTSVLDSFNHIVEDLKNCEPCGRLSLLLGPPGTGKTFALRGLIWALHKEPLIKCVAIPSNIVDKLGSPGVAEAFIENNVSENRTRHILFVEDADEALVTRGSDNLSTISALLNLTDGLIGQALDIRVVATTNAVKTDIDPAITRPGRLCSEVHFRALNPSEASSIATRLGRPPLVPERKYTLAEIYAWKGGTSKGQKSQLGFESTTIYG